MGKNKYLFVLWMLLAITLAGGIFTGIYVRLENQNGDDGKVQVVTSFYPIYIAAKNVVEGSEGVALANLSEPQTGCMHDYQLTPQDMIVLSKADLFLVNGGGIENFLSDVGKSYPDLAIRAATEGLALLEESGTGNASHSHDGESPSGGTGVEEGSYGLDTHTENSHNADVFTGDSSGRNAHGWMDTGIYMGMVKNIADFISGADKENEELYQENAKAYCEKIERLSAQIEELAEKLKEDFKNGGSAGKNIVIFHEAFAYVAGQYGLKAVYCLNLDEERQVSAGEVAGLLEEIAKSHVSVVLAEEQYGKDMGKTVEQETGCKVYYLDTLVRGDYSPDSYLDAMQKNIDIIGEALRVAE